MASLTHRYIPKIEQTEENLFIEEYYSSTDTKIYIDDIEQTEISYINYSVNEQLKPIYGYASNTFDDVAVGARIVTGILKTPISNSDKQSDVEDIKKRGLSVTYGDTTPNIGDYNDSESNSTNKTEWIGNTDKTPGSGGTDYEDDTSYEYRNKLELLGYCPEGSDSKEDLVNAIKQFQKDHGITPSGDLDSRTISAIDNAIENRDTKDSLTIPAGTMIYATPSKNTPLYPKGIPNETKAFVMGTFEGSNGKPEWLYIATSDGIEGCININDNPAFKEYLNKHYLSTIV